MDRLELILLIILLITIVVAICYKCVQIKRTRHMYTEQVEHYDARFTDQTVDDCANFCKTRAGCYGFAFDPKTKTCYPSNKPLIGQPVDSIYLDSYSDNNMVCNKLQTVLQPSKAVPFDERKSNATFTCAEKKGLQPVYYMHNKGKLNRIDTGQNPDFIPEIDKYEVQFYKWPNNRYDEDQLDLLVKNRESQYYTDNTVTSMDRVRDSGKSVATAATATAATATTTAATAQKTQIEQQLANRAKTVESSLTTNLSTPAATYGQHPFAPPKKSIKDRINEVPNMIKGVPSALVTKIKETPAKLVSGAKTVAKATVNAPKTIKAGVNTAVFGVKKLISGQPLTSGITSKKLYDVHSGFNNGKFLRDYKCVKDIPLDSCLRYCSDNDKCVGVEWNPAYSGKEQVCCPMETIGSFVNRSAAYKLGRFYKKRNDTEISPNEFYLHYVK